MTVNLLPRIHSCFSKSAKFLLLAGTLASLLSSGSVEAFNTGGRFQVLGRSSYEEWRNTSNETLLVTFSVRDNDTWFYNRRRRSKETTYLGKRSNPCRNSGCPRPDLPTGRLIYSVGDTDGPWRPVSDLYGREEREGRTIYTSPEIVFPGESVFFRMNDDKLSDNRDSITVGVINVSEASNTLRYTCSTSRGREYRLTVYELFPHFDPNTCTAAGCTKIGAAPRYGAFLERERRNSYEPVAYYLQPLRGNSLQILREESSLSQTETIIPIAANSDDIDYQNIDSISDYLFLNYEARTPISSGWVPEFITLPRGSSTSSDLEFQQIFPRLEERETFECRLR